MQKLNKDKEQRLLQYRIKSVHYSIKESAVMGNIKSSN